MERPRALRAMEDLPRQVGLSARLLALTVVFVMLCEVLIFAPSIGRYRLVFLEERLASAHLAGLAIDATPDRMVTAQLTSTLLHHVGAHAVGLYQDGKLTHNLQVPDLPAVDREIDLREESFTDLIVDAFATLAQRRNRILRVIGPSPKDATVLAVVVLDEQPLRDDMLDYAWRILGLSIVIALVTASLLYLSLQIMLVRPMRRLTQRMTAFHPELPAAAGADGGDAGDARARRRSDELGVAEQALS